MVTPDTIIIALKPVFYTVGLKSERADFVYNFAGDLCIYNPEGAQTDEYSNEKIGRFRCYYVNRFAAEEQDPDLFEVFDEHSNELCNLFDHLYLDSWGEPTKFVNDAFSFDHGCGRVFFIDRIEIFPLFRGKLLGLIAIKGLIDTLATGSSIVILKPFPLQYPRKNRIDPEWDEVMQMNQFPQKSFSACNKALKNYYGKIGFIDLPRSKYMILNPRCLLRYDEILSLKKGCKTRKTKRKEKT